MSSGIDPFNILLQDFDREDKANLGRPLYFNVEKYLSCVEEMIGADEITQALQMLDNMPGWYRDNKPIRAVEIKKKLLKQLYTPNDYAFGDSLPYQINNLEETINLGRAKIAIELVQRLNQDGIIPHITELAPGTFWLPLGLQKRECQFTYKAIALSPHRPPDVAELEFVSRSVEDFTTAQTHLFVCYELIEHLSQPIEIYQNYLKADKPFTHILLSTPRYTVSSAAPDWYNKDLGHLRTYTPREFAQFATDYWPDFKWTLVDGNVMVLVGEKSGS